MQSLDTIYRENIRLLDEENRRLRAELRDVRIVLSQVETLLHEYLDTEERHACA